MIFFNKCFSGLVQESPRKVAQARAKPDERHAAIPWLSWHDHIRAEHLRQRWRLLQSWLLAWHDTRQPQQQLEEFPYTWGFLPLALDPEPACPEPDAAFSAQHGRHQPSRGTDEPFNVAQLARISCFQRLLGFLPHRPCKSLRRSRL